MTLLIIDPPVGPWSSTKDIEAWIARLEAMKSDHDPEDHPTIEAEIEDARDWIKLRADVLG